MVERAFALLRPALKHLEVQKLTCEPKVFKCSSSTPLKSTGFGKWVIIARKISSSDGAKGRTTIVFDKKHNLFLLFIFIDESLFVDDAVIQRMNRKMIAVHEFVHCSAHMILKNYYGETRYIELMESSIIKKLAMTTSNEFNEMVSAIGKLGTKDGSTHEMFTDGHFRLLDKNYKDGFLGNYAELYTELMLSYQLVSETMTAIKNQHTNPQIGISELLTLTVRNLMDKKALDMEFVLGRIKLFLPLIFSEFT